jgi:replicative DNA helicase
VALTDDRGVVAGGFDKQPPQDLAAEQSVLGGMMLSKDAIADVVEVLSPGDFYLPKHQAVYDCVLDLYGRGEPADPITVSAELERRGELGRVGGAPYLHTLIATVPTAANAGYYAEIVSEKAVLRRLVEAGTRIVQMGYNGAEGSEIDAVVDRAQAAIYEVTERRMSEDYISLDELLQPTMDEIDAIASRGGSSLGVPTGFADLDEVTNGMHPGQMIIVAARPGVGKSTLGLDFTRSAAVKHGMTSVIFSLEMSRTEIVMRLLSAEAKIRLQDMRGGRMSDDDWTRLARRMSEISEAPLFIDDSPNMTMMEIRAKARRLRQRNDLKLIVVDYMQLMTSGKRVESRQQEVSEFSRQLKLLAKELEVPVVAISQLNRGPEQRTDKRPMLSDLRESGCLTRETTLLRADTGGPVTFGELLDREDTDVLVWSLDERRRLVAAPLTNVFPSGVKATFRLTLASGRTVAASGNHRFLAPGGWVALDDLAAGDRLAVPRRVPAPIAAGIGWTEHQLELLAQLIGDGGVQCGQPVRSSGLGVEDPRGTDKRIPDLLYQASDEEIRIFLRHLWATEGGVLAPTEQHAPRLPASVYYSTSSRALADGVALLLCRLGIPTRTCRVNSRLSKRLDWQVIVDTNVDTPPRDVATDDVCWDEIVSIVALGPLPVYDATVKGTHNFIADGILAHNSLEQDADMVLLINRPDAWERDDPRAGEADLIIAKHRAGPTATITVAHQLHYSRFTDLAQG